MGAVKAIFALILIGIVGGVGYFFYQGGTVSDVTDMISPDAPINDEDLAALYAQSRPDLIAGYRNGDNAIAKAYADWRAASTIPAAPGVHSGRYMMTYVNDIGYEAYTEYSSDNPDLPIGTQIAKESFMVKGEGRFSPSPFFTMEKVGKDAAPETDGWFYGRVNRNGRKMITSQKFCHDCHQAFRSQDFLGYPVTKARIGFDADAPKAEKVDFASVETGDVQKGEQVFQTCGACH